MGEMRDRMLAGEPYLASDPELQAELEGCALLREEYNATSVTDPARRRALLVQLLGDVGENVTIRPPIYFDYGYQTTIGRGTFINHDAVILDVGKVTIGEDVQMGPRVQLLTACTRWMPPSEPKDGRASSRSRSGTGCGWVAA